MKFQTTLAYTLLLLLAMFGAGTVSALYGFTVGYEALKGVKQPEGNPTQRLIRSHRPPGQGEIETPKKVEFVSERSVIVSVYDQIQAQEKELQKATAKPQKNDEAKDKAIVEPVTDSASSTAATPSNFPILARAEDLTLEIVKGEISGGDWLMTVNLQNDSQEAVTFLYNFLEVKTGEGRLLTTQVDGLPNEIPANRQKYSGTIRIPTVILGDIETLSLKLQDYPDREISLEIPSIPVVR